MLVLALATVRPILAASVAPVCLSFTAREQIVTSPWALDRRGGPRRAGGTTTGAREAVVDRFTAASHRPLPITFAVGVQGHWALMLGVSLSPHGLLLRALDPREAALERPAHDVLRGWLQLGRRLGPAASPLWLSTAALGARALVALLADRGASSEIAVELFALDERTALANRSFQGHVTRLIDPAPHILGVVLDDEHRVALERAVGRPARSPLAIGTADVLEITEPAGAGPKPAPKGPRARRGRERAASSDPADTNMQAVSPAGALQSPARRPKTASRGGARKAEQPRR